MILANHYYLNILTQLSTYALIVTILMKNTGVILVWNKLGAALLITCLIQTEDLMTIATARYHVQVVTKIGAISYLFIENIYIYNYYANLTLLLFHFA